MKILLIRHGETDQNAAKCYLGHYNAILNERGRQQARTLSSKLLRFIKKDSTFLYCSDLVRAIDTAYILSEHCKISPPKLDSSLRELSFGEWECKTYKQIFQESPQQVTDWINNPHIIAPPQGETLEELGKRVDQWFHHMLSKHLCNETVIIVSHQGPIRWLISKYYLGDPAKFWDVEGIKHGSGLIMEFNRNIGKAISVKNIG